ncbi:MAG: hypothetical protein NVS9B4_01080 [Candidatus Acidiferrum sp.]
MPSGSLTNVYASMNVSPSGFLPLLLATFTFADGGILRLSTSPLSVLEGGTDFGLQYGGFDYLGRLGQQDLAAVQALSPQGITLIPNLTVSIQDPDAYIWLNYELAAGKGFKGATLVMNLVLYDPLGKTFSSNAIQKFYGICDVPRRTRTAVSVQAVSLKNPQRVTLPSIHLQPRCWKAFPANIVQRIAAADDQSSQWWDCGYSPDAPGGNARGNGTYTTCAKTRAECVLRGMFSVDSANRPTARFGGFEWNGPTDFKGTSFLDGKTVIGYNTSNDARFNDLIALAYGTGWIDLAVLQPLGDPNSTRFEAIVCYGEVGTNGINDIKRVIAGGINVPYSNSKDKLFTWYYVTSGNRSGGANLLPLFDGKGDPYGSMSVIVLVLPPQLAQSSAVTQVKALANFAKILVPSSTDTSNGGVTSWPRVFTTNPVWILLDILIWSNFQYSDIDIASWQAAAAFCDTKINYTDANNVVRQHERYKAQLILRSKRSAADIIQGLLNSFDGMLVPNSNGNLLQLFIRQTLADQQPAPVLGSNYNVGIASTSAAGAAATGYAAFDFNETNVIAGTLETVPLPASETGNSIGITFQDEDNEYVQDAISSVDSLAIQRAGNQEIPVSYPIDGIVNFDQANRIINTRFGQLFRGNPRGDAGGTIRYQFETSTVALGLRIGHIVRFSWQQDGMTAANLGYLPLFRIESLKYSQNAERIQVLMSWHSDGWYQDNYGQAADPFYSDPRKRIPLRPPYPWLAGGEIGKNGTIYINNYVSFGVTAQYIIQADGSPQSNIVIDGRPPVNKFGSAYPPNVPQQGTTSNTGGTIGVGNYLIAFTSIDGSGGWSALSKFVHVVVPPGNTNTITVTGIYWPPDAVDGAVYISTDEMTLGTAGKLGALPASLTLTAIPNALVGPPDVKFDHFHVRVRTIIHSGCIGMTVSNVGPNLIQLPGYGPSAVNAFVGYQVSLLGWAFASAIRPLPILDSFITASSSDAGGNLNLTLASDFLQYGVAAYDVVVIRALPTNITSNTIGCTMFQNGYFPGGLDTATGEAGMLLTIIAGTGAGQEKTIASNTANTYTIVGTWDITPDATSVFIITDPTWQFLKPSATMEVTNAIPTAPQFISGNYLNNPRGVTLYVQVLTEDINDMSAPDQYAPFREVYQHGAGVKLRLVTAADNILPDDELLLCDSTLGSFQLQAPDVNIFKNEVIIKKISTDANVVTILAATGQDFDGAASFDLVNQYDWFRIAPGA